MQELMKELDKLNRKAIKYDDLMARATEFAKKLNQAAALLKEVADELDPKADAPRERSGINYEEVADDFYLKMQAGAEVNSDLVLRTYPDWKYGNAQMLLQNLAGRPNVARRKEGHKVYYYCKRDIR